MTHTCADCKINLEPIRVVDATQPSLGGSGATHVDLCYAPLNANQSWWTGTVQDTVQITGLICPRCRRISLFG